ncbi:MAG TPA: hypothetical protein VFQ76_06285 [Longimicrobiaceae bacterium]|nr:hypothetical protein [Longimicrobiaceae bacterium]
MRRREFAGRFSGTSRPVVIARRAALVVLAVPLAVATLSGWRAWVQVRSLELHAAAPVLRGGSRLQARVVTSGRTFVDLRLELVQGTHAETLAVRQVPKNRDAATDPRSRRDSLAVVLAPELLERFREGPVLVRAVARGRPQWLREPPPTVRELALEIRRPE